MLLHAVTDVPNMEVKCERVSERDGSFNVSVAVTLQESEVTTHISRFTLLPTVLRNGESVQTLKRETLVPQVIIVELFNNVL